LKRKFSPIKFGISAVVIVGVIFALLSVADGDEAIPFNLHFPLLSFGHDDPDNGVIGFIVDPETGEKLDDRDFVIGNE